VALVDSTRVLGCDQPWRSLPCVNQAIWIRSSLAMAEAGPCSGQASYPPLIEGCPVGEGILAVGLGFDQSMVAGAIWINKACQH